MKGHDIPGNAYLSRFAGRITLLDPGHKRVRPVNTLVEAEERRALFEATAAAGSEGGSSSRRLPHHSSPGRPNSGGSHLKYKFVKSLSFIVTVHNAKRSAPSASSRKTLEDSSPQGRSPSRPNT